MPNDGHWEKPALVLPPGDYIAAARTFVQSRNTRLIYSGDGWHAYDGYSYAIVSEADLKMALWTFLDLCRVTAGGAGTAPYRPNKMRIDNVVEAMKGECFTRLPEPCGWLDGEGPYPASEILACANGLVHLPTWTFLGPHGGFFSSVPLDTAFRPEAPEPRIWLEFLRQLWDDGDEIRALGELFGYLLIPSNRYQKLFQLVGVPRSGKGTILRALKAVIGAANCCSPSLASLAGRHGMTPLVGKSVALMGDNRIGRFTDYAATIDTILKISGGDDVVVDPKHRSSFTTTLGVRFVFAGNLPLTFDDRTGALKSRFFTLVMGPSFAGREDTDLDAKLYAEREGILLWALDGLRRLTERGRFVEPARSATAMVHLNRQADPLGTFVAERCVLAPSFQTPKAVLFEAWQEWCWSLDQAPGTLAKFSKALLALYPEIKTPRLRKGQSRTPTYRGIALRSSGPNT